MAIAGGVLGLGVGYAAEVFSRIQPDDLPIVAAPSS
jgi:hypothetical protein